MNEEECLWYLNMIRWLIAERKSIPNDSWVVEQISKHL